MNTEKRPRWDVFPSYEDQFALATTEMLLGIPVFLIAAVSKNEHMAVAMLAMNLHGAFGFIHAGSILSKRNKTK